MPHSSLRHRLPALLLLLGVATAAFPQLHGYSTDFGLSLHNFCDTIPIEVEDDQVYLRVEMDGRRYRFNLDTGSSQGAVCGLLPGSRLRELGNVVSRDANGRQDTVKVVSLPPFRIGRLTVSNYVASVLPRPAGTGRYDAIIGFDLFNKGLCAKIDTRQKVLILTDRRSFFADEAGYPVKYKLKWFVPYLYVSPFIRHVDEVLFDTGSRALYTMNKQSFDRHAYKSKNVGSQVEGVAEGRLAIGHYGTEERDEVAFLHLDRLKWGDFCLTDVRAITTQGTSRVGARLLRYGAVVIDPFRKRLVFQPHNGADSVRVGNKQPGTAFVPMDNRPTVGLIWEGSEAYRAGMREGDTILRIDGRPIPTFRDFVAFPFVEGRRYTFTLRDREGRVKEVVMER